MKNEVNVNAVPVDVVKQAASELDELHRRVQVEAAKRNLALLNHRIEVNVSRLRDIRKAEKELEKNIKFLEKAKTVYLETGDFNAAVLG